jgi:hypothetical protein
MLRLFGKTDKNSQLQTVARSYVGVVASEYGGDFNLSALILGEWDEELKAKPFFKVFIGNKVFDNLAEAVKQTSKRGQSKKSAYVIGLKCSADEMDSYREKGEFSHLIISITNAMTRKSVSQVADMITKPKKNDNSSNIPRSPTVNG